MTEEPKALEAQELPGDSQEQMPATSADVQALQVEVAQLRQQVAEGEKEKETLRRPWRRVAVGLLIVLGCLVLVVGNMAFWARHTVLNTDGWVAAVGPLSESEVVAEAVSVMVVRELDVAIGIGGGGAYQFARSWLVGANVRYGSWFFPQEPETNPLGDEASLAGQNSVFVLGLNVAYRVQFY